MGFWTEVKRVMRIGFRILAGVFMAVVVSSAFYWAWSTWQDGKLEARVSVAKTWTVQPLPMSRPVDVVLKTRCADSRLQYQLQLTPRSDLTASPATGAVAPETVVLQLIFDVKTYVVSFTDRDGFNAIEFGVPTSSFSQIVNEQGKPTSISADGSEICNRRAYERAVDARIGWHGDPKGH